MDWVTALGRAFGIGEDTASAADADGQPVLPPEAQQLLAASSHGHSHNHGHSHSHSHAAGGHGHGHVCQHGHSHDSHGHSHGRSDESMWQEPVIDGPDVVHMAPARLAGPGELLKSGPLTATQLLMFFQAFQNNLVKAETRDRLKAGVAKGFMAEDIMAEIEADVWIEQGIDPALGSASLRTLSSDYASNHHVLFEYQQFVERQALACDEVDLPPEEFQKKVAEFDLASQQKDVLVKLAMQTRALMHDPQTAELMKRRAAEHQAQFNVKYKHLQNNPTAMMSTAMEKLALARKAMAANGLYEQAIFGQAMAMLADPTARLPNGGPIRPSPDFLAAATGGAAAGGPGITSTAAAAAAPAAPSPASAMDTSVDAESVSTVAASAEQATPNPPRAPGKDKESKKDE